jgi:hypothetical protein
MRTAVLVLLLCGLLVGCHRAGTVPPGWRGEPVAELFTTPHGYGPAEPAGLGNGAPATGTLQVFVCYGVVLSNHTAVRLEAPGLRPLMWDPGGMYKHDDPSRARVHDVLTQNAATVEEWWRYRRDDCIEPIVEMFEWSLKADQARRLHAILLTHEDPRDPSQTFEPDAGGLQCSKRVSEFLSRFADGRPDVPDRYFWPHNLGEHLWTQSPDRVVVFRRDGDSLAYRRVGGSSIHE